jgi:hypothetical protein
MGCFSCLIYQEQPAVCILEERFPLPGPSDLTILYRSVQEKETALGYS